MSAFLPVNTSTTSLPSPCYHYTVGACLHLLAAPPSPAPSFSLGNESRGHSAQTGPVTTRLTAAAPDTERKKGGVCEMARSLNPCVSNCSLQVGPPSKPREAICAGSPACRLLLGRERVLGQSHEHRAVAADTSQLPPPSFRQLILAAAWRKGRREGKGKTTCEADCAPSSLSSLPMRRLGTMKG